MSMEEMRTIFYFCMDMVAMMMKKNDLPDALEKVLAKLKESEIIEFEESLWEGMIFSWNFSRNFSGRLEIEKDGIFLTKKYQEEIKKILKESPELKLIQERVIQVLTQMKILDPAFA